MAFQFGFDGDDVGQSDSNGASVQSNTVSGSLPQSSNMPVTEHALQELVGKDVPCLVMLTPFT